MAENRLNGVHKAERAKVNRLTGAQAYKLNTWLDAHREQLLAEGPTERGLAGRLSGRLGFAVTNGNVRAGLRAVGLVLPRAARKRAKGERFAALEARVAALEGQVSQLLRELGAGQPAECA